MTDPLEALSRFGRAISDPTRARVLLALTSGPDYPADLADTLGVSRQVMSNHLACLRGCGLVTATEDGRRTQYRLADDQIAHALTDLTNLALSITPGHQVQP